MTDEEKIISDKLWKRVADGQDPIKFIRRDSGGDLIQYELDKKRQVTQKFQSLLPEESQRKCLVEHMVQFQLTAEGILEGAREREADLIVLGCARIRCGIGKTGHASALDDGTRDCLPSGMPGLNGQAIRGW